MMVDFFPFILLIRVYYPENLKRQISNLFLRIMGKEVTGSSLMAIAGFFLMVSIEGKILGEMIRVIFFLVSVLAFFIGMKTYLKYMPRQSLSSNDWLIIIFSLLTPFIIVSSLNSLGLFWGGGVIVIWILISIVFVLRKDKVLDLLLPKLGKKSVEDEFEKIKRKYESYRKKR
jgi:peptidoglycan/LPS O-acetylase OafA/YrhL